MLRRELNGLLNMNMSIAVRLAGERCFGEELNGPVRMHGVQPTSNNS
jgi:hypothetical protein